MSRVKSTVWATCVGVERRIQVPAKLQARFSHDKVEPTTHVCGYAADALDINMPLRGSEGVSPMLQLL